MATPSLASPGPHPAHLWRCLWQRRALKALGDAQAQLGGVLNCLLVVQRKQGSRGEGAVRNSRPVPG